MLLSSKALQRKNFNLANSLLYCIIVRYRVTGSHTIGLARCTTYRARIFGDINTIDTSFAKRCRESAPEVATMTAPHHLTSRHQTISTTCTSKTCWRKKVFFIQTRRSSVEVRLILWFRDMHAICLHFSRTLSRPWSKWETSVLFREEKARSEAEK